MNNNFRRMFCVLVAAMLATFTLPSAAAPAKTYSFVISASPTYTNPAPPSQPVVNTPVPMNAVVKNESPPSEANSNIGSFGFTLTGLAIIADPSTITLTSCPSAGPCVIDTKATVTVTASGISVTNISPPIQAQGTYRVSFSAASCGDGSVGAVGVFTGSQLNGQSFGFKAQGSTLQASVNCGNLTCGTSFTVPGSSPTVTGQRGFYDKDGGTCPNGVDTFEYYLTSGIQILAGDIQHFRWPVDSEPNADPAAAFIYTIAAASGQPRVAWLTVNGTPAFIPAQGCAGGLPAPYTTLAANVAVGDGAVTVTSTPAGLPAQFPIVIGTERMQVTNIAGNVWSVTRGTGGTVAAKHSASDPVMSTPLPILPAGTPAPYQAGNQAQMCLVSQTIGANPSTTVIDIGDGWSSP